MDETDRLRQSIEAEFALSEVLEWQKWIEQIPFIQFKKDWEVRAIPPFGGAIIRYNVKKKGQKGWVSIYLDCYDRLGYFGEPYWEVYPFKGDVGRCAMKDTKTLIKMITTGLNEGGIF